MKKLLLCYFISVIWINARSQNWTWAEHAGGVLPDEANGCAIDVNGNLYCSGFYFSSSINFGNGNSLSNDGLSDGFIVKYNAAGSTQWASKMKGSLEDKTEGCAVDLAGNVFATGYFDSPSLQFGGNNNHHVDNFDNSGNTFDAFIVKYNSSGTPQWFHAIGKSDDDGGRTVATDVSGNCYVTGWFRAPSITAGSFTLYNKNTGGGSSDMFLIKYDPDGNVLWAVNAGSQDDDKGNGVTVDPSGNVIVTGYCKGNSIDFEGTLYSVSGSKDMFVAKYDASGNLLAAKTFGGTSSEEAFECSTDGHGNIFIAGTFGSSTIAFGNYSITNSGGGADLFLVKLDPLLNGLWAISEGSNSNDEARGCSTDSYGNTVITGIFSGNDIYFENTYLHNNGGDEIFLAKYDPDGNLIWAKKIGKSRDDGATDCQIDDTGRIIVAGYYNSSSLTLGTINFDNSYVGVATSDVFVATTCSSTITTDTQNACNSFTWINGVTYTASNNTAIHTIPGTGNSCDSLMLLDLTLNSIDPTVSIADPVITANAVGAQYRWLDCNNNYAVISGETSQTFVAPGNGAFAVEVTQNSCVDTSVCIGIFTVGITENIDADAVIVFPNPVSEQLIIVAAAESRIKAELFDVTGNKVHTPKPEITKEKTVLDISLLADGMYLLKISDGRGFVQIKKILKE